MTVFTIKSEIQAHISKRKAKGTTFGFVPTMGALHNGHLALVKRALQENDVCVVSIFVNPTQFDNPNDLQKYPRAIENDIALLKRFSKNIFIFCSSFCSLYIFSILQLAKDAMYE